MTVLEFDRVRFDYGGSPVLQDVSLTIGAGEGVALFGANGAGKTTLTRLAMALEHPLAGRVTAAGRLTDGIHPEDLAPVASYVFQRPEDQLVERTVAEEVAFGPRRLGWDPARVEESLGRVLTELGLAGEGGTHPYDLPLPLRRLVALASALVTEPRLLLLDEPTSGMDRATRETVQCVVLDRIGRGTAVLAVTHDPEFAVECLDRALVLESGTIVADEAIGHLLGRDDPNLPLPAVGRVARGLGLPAEVIRMNDVARALANRGRPEDGISSDQ